MTSRSRPLRASPRRGASAAPFRRGLQQIHTHVLANGLRLIVWRNDTIPNAVLHNYVRVGSRNEGGGLTGLAHFFEHMMFNGTPRHPQGDFDRLLEAQGGANNAYTSQDLTVYMDWFPRAALPLVFELESDRLMHLSLQPAVFENEREVVRSERRLRVDDSNAALLDEQLQATAFVAHPYRIPTIGWPADIDAWTLDDLQRFFDCYYTANNCTLVLVGDVQPQAVFELAERSFGRAPERPIPPAVRTREPPQQGERRLQLRRAGSTPLLSMAWHAMSASDERAAALNVLQTALLFGDGSRLHRALVERRRLLVEISGGWSETFDPSLFVLQATLPAGGSLAAAERAVDQALERVLQDGISRDELQRAQNIIAAEFWRALGCIDGQARLLGEYALLHGNYRQLFEAPERYAAVTRAAVREVARSVFRRETRTVGLLQVERSRR